jgi:uncharacterized protein (DUF1800 family)
MEKLLMLGVHAARKLGYGFSLDESLIDDQSFIKSAKLQLETLPDFHPWQFIAEFDKVNANFENFSNDFQSTLEKKQKKAIQVYLKEQDFYQFSIDGDLGKESRKAISEWQKAGGFESTGQLNREQYRLVLVYHQTTGSVELLNLPKTIGIFSTWDLSQADLRYPTNLKRTIKHRRELNDERERLRKLYAEGKIPQSELQRLWWQRFNAFPWWRDTMTRGLDNVHGSAPVLNRFWHFWINYFAVNVDACEGELFGSYYLQIRGNLTGKFEDLLYDAVWHPAMQEFLQNSESTGPNSKRAKYKRKKGKIAAINENLAREILELFTLTPAAGYSQDDVNNVAYILTGYGRIDDDDIDDKYFSPSPNEPGNHKVLGKVYNQPAQKKLRALCVDLAKDPRTARHIATKLSKHFIADEPPTEATELISDAYIKSDGDLIKVHQATVEAVIKYSKESSKFLQPEIWFFQIHKAIGGYLPLTFEGKTAEQRSRQIDSTLYELGHLNSRTPQPNGWSDLAVDWLTPEMMDRRVRYVGQLAIELDRDKKFDPFRYAEALFGKGTKDELFVANSPAPEYKNACLRLFCNPKFMRA